MSGKDEEEIKPKLVSGEFRSRLGVTRFPHYKEGNTQTDRAKIARVLFLKKNNFIQKQLLSYIIIVHNTGEILTQVVPVVTTYDHWASLKHHYVTAL